MSGKRVLLLAAILVMCMVLFAVYTHGERAPVPDAILLYRNGTMQRLTQEDAAFSQFYSPVFIQSGLVQETAMDPETVTEIKSALAMEYRYEQMQEIGERSYCRILFSLSGWTENSAILFLMGNISPEHTIAGSL